MEKDQEKKEQRVLSAEEIAVFVKQYRDTRKWSQEQLAEISGLSVRTVQRVEQGLSSSFDTRRAICRAFELDDIDYLNKPFLFIAKKEYERLLTQFNQEHIRVPLVEIKTGQQLASRIEQCEALNLCRCLDLGSREEAVLADLVDYSQEYLDSFDLYSQPAKVEVYDYLDRCLSNLRNYKLSLWCGECWMTVRIGGLDNTFNEVNLKVLHWAISEEGKNIKFIFIEKKSTS